MSLPSLIVQGLRLLQLAFLLLPTRLELIVEALLQLKLLLGVLVVDVVQFALLLEQLELEVFGELRVATEDFLDLRQVLLGHLVAEKLVDLLDQG